MGEQRTVERTHVTDKGDIMEELYVNLLEVYELIDKLESEGKLTAFFLKLELDSLNYEVKKGDGNG